MIKKIIKFLWIFLVIIVLLCVGIFTSISNGWIGYMPPVEELENPDYKFAAEIFSEDGKVLGTFSLQKNNRVYSSYADLSPAIIHALIATEDVRFTEHSGIDAKALFRALVNAASCCRKAPVAAARSRSSLPNSSSRKKWRATPSSACFKNRSNG